MLYFLLFNFVFFAGVTVTLRIFVPSKLLIFFFHDALGLYLVVLTELSGLLGLRRCKVLVAASSCTDVVRELSLELVNFIPQV